MPMTKQSVVVTKPDADTVRVAVGNETYDVSIERLKEIWGGTRDVAMLIFQFHVALQQAGVNPNTATDAQIKNAIEAQTYWWGG